MALIKCPECAREISDNSAFCVGCGYMMPIFKNFLMNRVDDADEEVVATKEIVAATTAAKDDKPAETEKPAEIVKAVESAKTETVKEPVKKSSRSSEKSRETKRLKEIESCLKKARNAEDKNDDSEAMKFYEQTLSLDPANEEAKTRREKILERTHFFTEEIHAGMYTGATIVFRYGRIDYVFENRLVRSFRISNMEHAQVVANEFSFIYEGEVISWVLEKIGQFLDIFKNAQMNIYKV